MSDAARPPESSGEARAYETERARVWIVVLCGIGLLAITAVLALAVTRFDRWVTAAVSSQPLAEPKYEPANAVTAYTHWVNPPADLAAVRQRDAQRLSEYAWVNRDNGSVRIPIERAMELLVAEHANNPKKDNDRAVEGSKQHDD